MPTIKGGITFGKRMNEGDKKKLTDAVGLFKPVEKKVKPVKKVVKKASVKKRTYSKKK